MDLDYMRHMKANITLTKAFSSGWLSVSWFVSGWSNNNRFLVGSGLVRDPGYIRVSLGTGVNFWTCEDKKTKQTKKTKEEEKDKEEDHWSWVLKQHSKLFSDISPSMQFIPKNNQQITSLKLFSMYSLT